ncbi:glycosyltransferase family 2 protein [Frigoribacterium sp. 2-23]|uniref:glycosyltransferase family 2 protein n=1 Tax=Frigoribacterium sp. 2-23 TaxID=3415006 RepID=UPI003C6EEB76
MTALHVARPMTSPERPTWGGALWVGAIDIDDLARSGVDDVVLDDCDGYRAARLLVRRGRDVLGFIEVPVVAGHVPADLVRAETLTLPTPVAAADSLVLPAVTVVLCTRDRAEQLRGALTSVLALDYPAFDVIVVDNAAATSDTRDLVAAEFDDERVRLVSEPKPGLSSARNTGLLAATGEIVAFTDDDVVVDREWLRGIVSGFAHGADVVCVSGLVPSGEIRTAVQSYFDDRVSWSKNVTTRVFRLADRPDDLPLFPFSVGAFGTGANFALRRDDVIALGGFDTAFGVGTRTGGGEDLDIFTRVLFAGHALVVEPSAVVWHRHRSDLAALRTQATGYGTGLGAWLTKIALDPGTLALALRRAPRALRHLFAKDDGDIPSVIASEAAGQPRVDWAGEVARVGRHERMSVLRGPLLYLRQRWDGAGLIPAGRRPARRAVEPVGGRR